MRVTPIGVMLLLSIGASVHDSYGQCVTFHKDVEAILHAKCPTCHRPGTVAPMSWLTYESARPWARAIKAAILAKKMPPGQGFEGVHFSKQEAEMSLTQSQIDTIVSWVDTGAPQGDPKDAPPPRKFDTAG